MTAERVASTVRDASSLTRTALVSAPGVGPMLSVAGGPGGAGSTEHPLPVLAGGLTVRVVSERQGACRLLVRAPGALADEHTIRLVQQSLIEVARGGPAADDGLQIALRYAQWQQTVNEAAAAGGPAMTAGAEAQEWLGLWCERRQAETGDQEWHAAVLGHEAADAIHHVAERLDATPDAVLLGCWRAVMLALGCTVSPWVGVDGRRPPIPTHVAGQLSAYRRWAVDGPAAASLPESIRLADGWLAEAAAGQPAWDSRLAPAARPLLAYRAVPPHLRVKLGDQTAELRAPVPAPVGRGIQLSSAIGAERVDIGLWAGSARLRAADAEELLAVLGRAITRLPESIRTDPSPGRPPAHAAGNPPAGEPAPAPRPALWRRLCEHAAERPQAPAVGCADFQLSYRELVRRAAGVARCLRTAGVRPGDRVGLLAGGSPDLVVAMLGVYAAGAAYVPLDAQIPPARMSAMLAGAGTVLTLSTADMCDSLPAGGRILRLDDCHPAPDADIDPDPDADADALAYVLFTSGSSGTPKGVMVSRRGLDNYLRWAARTYPFGAGSGVIAHTSPAFDLSVTTLLAPLLAGAYIHMVPASAGLDAVRDAIRRVGDVSVLKVTPAQLSLLVRAEAPAPDGEPAAPSVRALVVGGEDLPADLAGRWRALHPECAIVNEYGPTETVVGCTAWRMDGTEAGLPTIPIGHPIDGMRAYVLDRDLRPVDRGVPGELCIAGAGVAWGYAADPRLTAQRFVPDPWGPAGSVMYRSGDLVADTASCGLRFGGRLDRQVKLYGHRVEPAEIEVRLREIDGIVDAAVAVTTLPSGERALVGYVVPATDDRLDPGAVRAALGRHLPPYLIPSLFQALPRLPLTASGKVDARRLPVPGLPPATAHEGLTPTQELVRRVWVEVLGVAPPGLDTRFFEAGGASYTLVKVNALLRAALGRDIPIADMFAHATIRQLAAFLDGHDGTGDAYRTEEISRADGAGRRLASFQRLRSRREGGDE